MSTFVGYLIPKPSFLKKNIIIVIMTGKQHRFPWFFLSNHSYHPLLPAGPTNCIWCPHKADINKFLLVGLEYRIHVNGSIKVNHLRVHPGFYTSTPHVLFILLWWFVRLEVGKRTVAVLWGIASRSHSKQHIAFSGSSHLAFFSMNFAGIYVVYPFSSTDKAKAWKKSLFILSERLDFHMIDNLLIAIHIFTWHMLTSLSVDEILLPSNVNFCFNFKYPLLKRKMAPSCLKHMNFVLIAFTWKPMPHATCSRLCSRDLAWVGVFVRSTRLSA